MSEDRYYEFRAIDRPLDAAEQAEVRELSTRASITATSVVNGYHRGDFRGDPDLLVERYHDAHLYLADRGARRVVFRLPDDLLDLDPDPDPDVVEEYRVDQQVEAHHVAGFVVLDFPRLDDDLLATAARTSPPLGEDDPGDLADWWRARRSTRRTGRCTESPRGRRHPRASGDAAPFRGDTPASPAPDRRTVGELLDDAARQRAEGGR